MFRGKEVLQEETRSLLWEPSRSPKKFVVKSEDGASELSLFTGGFGWDKDLLREYDYSSITLLNVSPNGELTPFKLETFSVIVKTYNNGNSEFLLELYCRVNPDSPEILQKVVYGEDGKRQFKGEPEKTMDRDLANFLVKDLLYSSADLPEEIDTMATIKAFIAQVKAKNFEKPHLFTVFL